MQSACDSLLYRTYLESWKKGEKYADEGKVEIEKFDDKSVIAHVAGTKLYETKLSFRGSGISRNCSCPVSDFCKHMVAVAILWDELRGIQRPTAVVVESKAIPPPLISRADINKAYADPVNADLNVIRLAVDDYALSPRPHARLPNAPHFDANLKQPLTLTEVKKAWSEIKSWSRKSTYDYYFCAGEMVAAFCETMRMIISRLEYSDILELAKILRSAQKFHYELIMELVDDSDGLHEFTEAHLDELYGLIKKKINQIEEKNKVENLLKEFDEHRDDY
ncbi:MAG: SWIM zinc finger family protein [Candidatus Cloacimonetes bacterium]|nr:SWIM zinc finger family protein [Candidatus Cloacimonadota bacterium]